MFIKLTFILIVKKVTQELFVLALLSVVFKAKIDRALFLQDF